VQPTFGGAAITLGIGPHSNLKFKFLKKEKTLKCVVNKNVNVFFTSTNWTNVLSRLQDSLEFATIVRLFSMMTFAFNLTHLLVF